MTAGLQFVDRASVDDLGRYAGRARALDPDGAIRLQVAGTVLAAWVGVLPGHGLMGDGTVLGLRTFALAPPAEDEEPQARADLDVSVPLGAVTDRTSRTDLGTRFPIPPTRAFPQWGALTPPRSGWAPAGVVSTDDLVASATAGITEIGQGAGPGSGALAVADLRARVWGRGIEETPGVRAGAGFAAYGLGFLSPTGTVPVHRNGPWTRLTCPGGYVLTR